MRHASTADPVGAHLIDAYFMLRALSPAQWLQMYCLRLTFIKNVRVKSILPLGPSFGGLAAQNRRHVARPSYHQCC